MKKLAIVLAALLLACVFVGCAVGEKALLGKWEYDYGTGKEYWEFNEDGTFKWGESVSVNENDGQWVYELPNITISDFADSYNGVWSVDFVSADEMKWTIVSYTNPDFKNNKEKQEKGETFTLKKVVEDAE